MKTLDQFTSDYNGKTKGYPNDSSYEGECLSIVKLYIKECFGINPPPSGSNSAYGYWSNFPDPLGTVFEKVKYTPGMIPQKGWTPVWKPTPSNSFGHIDIVADDSATDTQFMGFDQNWNGRQAHFQSHNYNNVEGFLKPINQGGSMTDAEWQAKLDAKDKELAEEKQRSKDAKDDRGRMYMALKLTNSIEEDYSNEEAVKKINYLMTDSGTAPDLSKYELNGLNVTDGNYTYNYKLKGT